MASLRKTRIFRRFSIRGAVLSKENKVGVKARAASSGEQ